MNPITQQGLDNLKKELDNLKKEFDMLPKIIGEAREKGDLKENAEYHSAKERQGMLNAMIAKINQNIVSSQVIDPKDLPDDRVTFGKRVLITNLETNEKEIYTIVGNAEADMSKNKISIASQVAKGLIGKQKNDRVEISVPSGIKKYQIDGIEVGSF